LLPGHQKIRGFSFVRDDIKAIAWDFDGVLNLNIDDGRFVWADTLEEDLGIPLTDFETGIFDASFHRVISGKVDLLDQFRTAWTGPDKTSALRP
jgi:putative hydrolase of the HAD superfamily